MTFAVRLLATLRSILYSPIYLVLFVMIMLLFLLFTWIPGQRKIQDLIIRAWAWVSLFPFGIRTHAAGFENVPSNEGFLYVFNHQSHLDIPVCCATLPRSFRFGAKIELYRIPLFGSVLRRMGALPIARQNRQAVFRVYEEAKERARKGEVFILAPEGTRQDRPEVGPFKMGPFVLAIDMEMPIVPVVLYGAFEALPKGHLLINPRRFVRHVHVQILPPVLTKGMSHKDRVDLQNRVREKMLSAYAELRSRVNKSESSI